MRFQSLALLTYALLGWIPQMSSAQEIDNFAKATLVSIKDAKAIAHDFECSTNPEGGAPDWVESEALRRFQEPTEKAFCYGVLLTGVKVKTSDSKSPMEIEDLYAYYVVSREDAEETVDFIKLALLEGGERTTRNKNKTVTTYAQMDKNILVSKQSFLLRSLIAEEKNANQVPKHLRVRVANLRITAQRETLIEKFYSTHDKHEHSTYKIYIGRLGDMSDLPRVATGHTWFTPR
jgi:hypothetical protein